MKTRASILAARGYIYENNLPLSYLSFSVRRYFPQVKDDDPAANESLTALMF